MFWTFHFLFVNLFDINPNQRLSFFKFKACEVYSPELTYYVPTSLILPTDTDKLLERRLPPLIYHIRTEEYYENICDMITSETGLDLSYVKELQAFGAIYLSIPDEKSRLSKPGGSPGRREDGMTKATRVSQDFLGPVPNQSYCRVHASPKRYYGGYSISDWSTRIHQTQHKDILIVDKVADLPMAATTGNGIENLLYHLSNYLYGNKLQNKSTNDNCFVTSRLDACTSGITTITTTSSAASIINKELANRTIKKTYKVLCRSPREASTSLLPCALSAGMVVRHCFRRKRLAHENSKPTLLRKYNLNLLNDSSVMNNDNISSTNSMTGSDWQLAELVITKIVEVNPHEINLDRIQLKPLTDFYDNHNNNNNSNINSELEKIRKTEKESLPAYDDHFYECEVDLVTGRTHQIRLQFAALGFPVVGDTRYEPVIGLLDEEDTEEDGTDNSCSASIISSKVTGWGDGSDIFGPDPSIIGLQCYKLRLPVSIFPNITLTNTSSSSSPTSSVLETELLEKNKQQENKNNDNVNIAFSSNTSLEFSTTKKSSFIQRLQLLQRNKEKNPSTVSSLKNEMNAIRVSYENPNYVTYFAGRPWWRKTS